MPPNTTHKNQHITPQKNKKSKQKVRFLCFGCFCFVVTMVRDEETTGGEVAMVVDGSDIKKLVDDEEDFSKFVEEKFTKLDCDRDGKLSVKELQPVVEDIGVALGLPAKGESPESDHLYSEVLNEFTHGKEKKVSKEEFKEVLSDILLGMATGLERDPIIVLRIDGADLKEFISGPSFELEIVSIFSQIGSPDATIQVYITQALGKLSVDHGLPPTSDSWVVSNIVEPALQSCVEQKNESAVTEEEFLKQFKRVAENIVGRLKDQPVIVAHTGKTFNGSGVRRLLGNKSELEKAIDGAMETLPRDREGKLSKEYLRVALDSLAPSAGLPPYGALHEVDIVISNVFKMVNADNGKLVKEEEFKKLLTEILGSIMLQLEGNPISVSSNSVVHEPLAASASSLLET
ncbi:hypothetical protein Droror1_Dr00006026 [Drosera rotundifolia]